MLQLLQGIARYLDVQTTVTAEPLRDGPAMAHHPTQELADPPSRPAAAIASHPGSSNAATS